MIKCLKLFLKVDKLSENWQKGTNYSYIHDLHWIILEALQPKEKLKTPIYFDPLSVYKPNSCRMTWSRQQESIGLHVNAKKKKTEYMCFTREGVISSLNCDHLKLVDKLTYIGSSVSSTESHGNMNLSKACTAIDKISIILNSDISEKIIQGYFQAVVVTALRYACPTCTLLKCIEKKIKWELDKNATSYNEQIQEAISH